MAMPPGGPQTLWELFQAKGKEDIAWWASNKPRLEQQVALGMLGPLERIEGGITPVAVVEDVSALGQSQGEWHFFGAYVGSQVAFTPVLEINTPALQTTSVLVYRVFGNIRFTPAADMIVSIRTPSPTTGLALISNTPTELDDGWGAYAQSHECRVFVGYAPETAGVNLCAVATITDAHGAVQQMRGGDSAGGDFHMFGTPMLIPRGRNLVVHQTAGSGVPANNCFTWGVVLREIHAPGGPT